MFSYKQRAETIEKLKSTEFDLLIIGGGITGVGTALDAAGRKLKVALIEMQDFAAGTSSRSTKLIHGGLRYLKQLEIGLVMEVGHERRTVYHNAPHLVMPEKMLLPITENGSFGKYSASLGIFVYDRLAGVKRQERRKMLSRQQTMVQEPLIRTEELVAGALYWEYRSDDARLVIEVAKTAANEGAVLLNYCRCDAFRYDDGKVTGIAATDLLSGQTLNIRAKKTINAAGPWVDRVRHLDEPVKGKKLHLTKGVHLVFDHSRLPLQESVYFDVGDGRMIFAIPRDGCTYVGTTDTDYHEAVERPRVTQQDADYLLKAVNAEFNVDKLTMADIRSSWAGLRPLINEDGKSPEELSRKDEIFLSNNGLISIAGGKLTGYRKMAERTVDMAMNQLHAENGLPYLTSRTSGKKLSGSGFHSLQAFMDSFGSTRFDKKQLGRIYHRFGSNAAQIMASADEQCKDAELALLLAQLAYCIEHEAVTELSDFLIRRTGMLYFQKNQADRYAAALNEALAERLGLTAEKKHLSMDNFLKESAEVLSFVS